MYTPFSREGPTLGTENRSVVVWDRGWGLQRVDQKGQHESSFWHNGDVLSLDCGGGDVILRICPTHRTLHQKE